MSPGNVSYWFIRKEDLVRALMEELRDRNSARPTSGRVTTVRDLLEALRAALRAQLEYRCLTESIVHVARTWPELGAAYRETEGRRRRALATTVRDLRHEGALRGFADPGDVVRLVATWSLVARFWLSERGLSYPDRSNDEAFDHYLAVIAHSLRPFVAEPVVFAPYLDRAFPEAESP